LTEIVKEESSLNEDKVPTMVVYLNNLTKCEVEINEKMTKKEILDQAYEKLHLSASISIFTISLWIEHKENKDIDLFESPYKAWDENKKIPTNKFHLHRIRSGNIKMKFEQLGEDIFSYVPILESNEVVDKTPISNTPKLIEKKFFIATK